MHQSPIISADAPSGSDPVCPPSRPAACLAWSAPLTTTFLYISTARKLHAALPSSSRLQLLSLRQPTSRQRRHRRAPSLFAPTAPRAHATNGADMKSMKKALNANKVLGSLKKRTTGGGGESDLLAMRTLSQRCTCAGIEDIVN